MEKEKEKAGSCPPIVWDDEGMVVEWAHGVVNVEDLKVFSGVSLNTVASQHVHKIVQVKYFCIFQCPFFLFFLFFLTDGLSFLSQVLGESLHIASKCLT